jgi:hypothetical protein
MSPKRKKSPETSAEPAEARDTTQLNGPCHEQIASHAYVLWQKRGCPNHSPQEDWFKAEMELAAQGTKKLEV